MPLDFRGIERCHYWTGLGACSQNRLSVHCFVVPLLLTNYALRKWQRPSPTGVSIPEGPLVVIIACSSTHVDHSSLWTRNRQVQVAPLLARAEENARLGAPPAESVVVNMGDILADDPALLNAIKPKKHETLFGPSLGDINPGPAWTSYGKQDSTKDELTQETVKAWIAKSKEVRLSQRDPSYRLLQPLRSHWMRIGDNA
jgi:hypothetical protein